MYTHTDVSKIGRCYTLSSCILRWTRKKQKMIIIKSFPSKKYVPVFVCIQQMKDPGDLAERNEVMKSFKIIWEIYGQPLDQLLPLGSLLLPLQVLPWKKSIINSKRWNYYDILKGALTTWIPCLKKIHDEFLKRPLRQNYKRSWQFAIHLLNIFRGWPSFSPGSLQRRA